LELRTVKYSVSLSGYRSSRRKSRADVTYGMKPGRPYTRSEWGGKGEETFPPGRLEPLCAILSQSEYQIVANV